MGFEDFLMKLNTFITEGRITEVTPVIEDFTLLGFKFNDEFLSYSGSPEHAEELVRTFTYNQTRYWSTKIRKFKPAPTRLRQNLIPELRRPRSRKTLGEAEVGEYVRQLQLLEEGFIMRVDYKLEPRERVRNALLMAAKIANTPIEFIPGVTGVFQIRRAQKG